MSPGQIAAELRLLCQAVTQLDGKLDRIIKTLTLQGKLMSQALTDLTSQVSQNVTLEGSIVQLLTNIASQLAAAGTDPVKLAALTSQLKTSGDAVSAAILANTPVAPPAPTP